MQAAPMQHNQAARLSPSTHSFLGPCSALKISKFHVRIHILSWTQSVQSSHQQGLSRTEPGSSTGTLPGSHPAPGSRPRTQPSSVRAPGSSGCPCQHNTEGQVEPWGAIGPPEDREGRGICHPCHCEQVRGGGVNPDTAQETVLSGRWCFSKEKEVPSETPVSRVSRTLSCSHVFSFDKANVRQNLEGDTSSIINPYFGEEGAPETTVTAHSSCPLLEDKRSGSGAAGYPPATGQTRRGRTGDGRKHPPRFSRERSQQIPSEEAGGGSRHFSPPPASAPQLTSCPKETTERMSLINLFQLSFQWC